MSRPWTNNPVTISNLVRAIYINELRAAINADRASVGLGAFGWSDGSLVSSASLIRAQYFLELRAAIQVLWTNAGMGTLPNWSMGSAPSSSRQISAHDMNDLRAWVDQYENHKSYGQLAFAWWGCDGSSNRFPCPSADFYVAQLGFGTHAPNAPASGGLFNSDSATRVGRYASYGYWFLYGPHEAEPGQTPYQWGQAQGDAAWNAWASQSYVARLTIFGDVEDEPRHSWSNGADPSSSPGTAYTVSANRDVWQGFADAITVHQLIPGLYARGDAASYQNWGYIMGGLALSSGLSVWSFQQVSQGCDSCPTAQPSLASVGGVAPIWWQYNQGPPGAGGPCPADLNLAVLLPL